MSERGGARLHPRRLAHLTTRFFTSLRVRPLDDATLAWVRTQLEPGELRVWEGMGRADRAEAVAGGRGVEIALAGTPGTADTRWVAAALAHDVGKQCSDYGTTGRVVATALAALLGEARVREWVTADRPTRARIGRYVAHDELGASLLRTAGARPEVAAWAGAHHRPGRWGSTGIPPEICRALAAADGESVSE